MQSMSSGEKSAGYFEEMWSFLCITYLNHRNVMRKKKKKKGNLGSLEAYRSLYAFLKIKSDAHEGVCVST